MKIFARRLLFRDLEKCSLCAMVHNLFSPTPNIVDVISRFQKQMLSTLALLQSIFNLYFRSLRANCITGLVASVMPRSYLSGSGVISTNF